MQGKFINSPPLCTNRVFANTLGRSLSLAIHNISQAARSPNPSYLFDAAAPTHLAKWFKLSKRETRQLQQYLDVLVRKASLRIEAAFPVVTSSSLEDVEALGSESIEDKSENEAYVRYTTDRAHYDGNYHYFTYMKIPNDLPWDAQGQTAAAPADNTALVDGISVADATPGWSQALLNHYRVSE